MALLLFQVPSGEFCNRICSVVIMNQLESNVLVPKSLTARTVFNKLICFFVRTFSPSLNLSQKLEISEPASHKG